MISFKAAVVGLGQIGQGYDYDYDVNDLSRIQTHATGYHFHPGFELVGGVDPNPALREKFLRKFQVPAYASVQDLLIAQTPTVFSIGVPTAFHFDVFNEVLSHRPQGVLCEKPIAAKVADAEMMVELAVAADCRVLVNYMRRFDPAVERLKGEINDGIIGEIYKGTVWYSKGLLNNGSHFIDLLIYLLGEPVDFKIMRPGRAVLVGDFEPDVMIQFGQTVVYFLAGREEDFSMKDIELVGTNGLIRYLDGGGAIEIVPVVKSEYFSGQRVLSESVEKKSTGYMATYQAAVTEALYQSLATAKPPNSDGKSALSTLKIVQSIFSKL